MSNPKPRQREDVRVESLPDGSAVLYDDRQEKAFPLTSSAAHIWKFCDGARTVDAIVTELTEIYDAEREVVERDVGAFLRQLADLNLLR